MPMRHARAKSMNAASQHKKTGHAKFKRLDSHAFISFNDSISV